MSSYSIRDLERISNQKAHTIRIWEQRYGLLEPDRTDTNIRNYNDDQLKKLLNVCSLLKRGMKISHISKLSKEEMACEIEKMIHEEAPAAEQFRLLTDEALIAVSTYDTAKFEDVFSDAAERFGIRATYEGLLYPLLVRAGLMWVKDDILPAQEHFLSNLIRQKLFSAIDQLPAAQGTQTWVLFLHEEEDHEIGLLFACYLIRERGHKAVYLGARVPFENLAHVVSQVKPTHLYSFIVRNHQMGTIPSWLDKLSTDFPGVEVCISGSLAEDRADNIHHIKDIGTLAGIIDLHA
ncbi:MerR family transcriptional regulator [Dyadobacter sandarakinus]|uniref:MerR family transcriptional regulator n=1 Tax=Dyadobacter sandarakinus TaxID=2747268 RepID=A0ABX7I4V8_9BACT|nr:MerR family transcriptional regulator [Dyadobacter sandarakinus]QRR00965.1 MerR family transcriptional regulator [Dyadobacter sandarakinus]